MSADDLKLLQGEEAERAVREGSAVPVNAAGLGALALFGFLLTKNMRPFTLCGVLVVLGIGLAAGGYHWAKGAIEFRRASESIAPPIGEFQMTQIAEVLQSSDINASPEMSAAAAKGWAVLAQNNNGVAVSFELVDVSGRGDVMRIMGAMSAYYPDVPGSGSPMDLCYEARDGLARLFTGGHGVLVPVKNARVVAEHGCHQFYAFSSSKRLFTTKIE